MKKSELVQTISSKSGMSKTQVSEVLTAFTSTIIDVMKQGDQVVIPGLCTFSTGFRAARDGRNPQTGAKIHIPAARVPKIKAGKNLKDAVQEA
ncbi:MAG: HU family DNA-binding protein [Legionellaceae bacterium]|nr:HU family DNA-binding protein [Legionellaceae bacterium]